MPRRALITGAAGQDGWYLLRFLSGKGYELHAHTHDPTVQDQAATWHHDRLQDPAALRDLILRIAPDEIYNLYALSQPQLSLTQPFEALQANAIVPQRIFEVVRNELRDCRVFQASSSEMFGDTVVSPQDESTPFVPQTPYAITKLYAHQMAGAYRRHFGLFLSSGVLFNHESPRRSLKFVSQKIAHAAACVSLGLDRSPWLDERGEPIVADSRVLLGSLEVRRDFGFAGDYVEAMWAALQIGRAEDFVIGTGIGHSIGELCEMAFEAVGRDWRDHVLVDPKLIRAIDSRLTLANIGRARALLEWEPRTTLRRTIGHMVEAQQAFIRRRLQQLA